MYRLVILAALVQAPGSAAGEIEGPNAAEVAPTRTPALPTPPQVRLSPISGFEDDTAHLASISSRVAELVQQAEQANDRDAGVELRLAAANLILAHELEPACTRRLLGLTDGAVDGDPARLVAALDRADALINDAQASLRDGDSPAPVRADDPRDGRLEELARKASTLRAFGHALRAYLLTTDDPETNRQARRAASGLSAVLEDRDPQVAAAAAFWQACLRAGETDVTAAMSVLDMPLADPASNAMPYAFFSRLVRCRLLAIRGGPAVGLGMLVQMEERCNDWFTTPSDRQDALRTCAWIRLVILRDWYDRLLPDGRNDELAWCADQAERLRAEHFKDDSPTVRRVSPAIPIIVAAPTDDLPTLDVPQKPD
jgi:hypothetical protein